MNDAYAEWLVKRKTPAMNHVIKAGIIVLCVLSFFLAMISLLGLVVLIAVGIGAYFFLPQLSLEFEYLVVNDQITVDKVMGQTRRRKAWEGTLDQVQIIGPVDAYQVKDYERQITKTLDFTSHMPGAKVYAIIQQDSGNMTRVLWEPNDRILNVLRGRSPRKVLL